MPMPQNLLRYRLKRATLMVANGQLPALPSHLRVHVDEVIDRSENAKAVLTVLLTSLVYKILHPSQDIRKHQVSINGGYSGRTFDTAYITPFLKEERFPAMAQSGWLTRSLEQKVPYDNHYTGSIKPQILKDAFLLVIDYIQQGNKLFHLLDYILVRLIRIRQSKRLPLTIPQALSISQLLRILQRHFEQKYPVQGAARLPVLAIYAIYETLLPEVKRFSGCTLLPLESHTSADRQSGRMGDVDVVDATEEPFEAVEVKHQITISRDMLETAYEKFRGTKMKRYYILSTASVNQEEADAIEQRIQDIKNTHGCQVIVNGIYATLRYYLRLLDDPILFIQSYTRVLGTDASVKYEHKKAWNVLVEEIQRTIPQGDSLN